MTAPAVGENLAFGIAEQSDYASPAAVTRFYPIISETLEATTIPVDLQPVLIGGARNGELASRDVKSGEAAAGDVHMEVSTTNMGLWFKHLLGGAAISGSGAAKTQTFTTGTVLGLSLSAQKAVHDAANVLISPFTHNGMKILKGAFSIAPNGALLVTWTVDSRQEETSTGPASPVYVASTPFVYSQGVLALNGSTVANVATASLDYENPADVNRRFLGNQGFKDEPTDTAKPTVSGTFSAEFINTTAYAWFKARTPVSMLLTFTSTTNIPTTSTPFSISFSVPNVILNGTTPKAGGPGIITTDLPWIGRVNAAGNPLMTVTYVSSDTTP